MRQKDQKELDLGVEETTIAEVLVEEVKAEAAETLTAMAEAAETLTAMAEAVVTMEAIAETAAKSKEISVPQDPEAEIRDLKLKIIQLETDVQNKSKAINNMITTITNLETLTAKQEETIKTLNTQLKS